MENFLPEQVRLHSPAGLLSPHPACQFGAKET